MRKRTYDKWAGDVVEDELLSRLEDLEKTSSPYGHYRSYKAGAHYRLDAADAITYLFAAIAFILSVYLPEYQIGFLFGVGLLVSILTRSVLMRIATVIFTGIYFVIYLLTGFYLRLEEVFNIILFTNTIALVPVIAGALMSILAMCAGAVHGLAKSQKYAGIWLLGLAFGVSVADALIAYFLLGFEDWFLILSTHLIIYTIATLIAWGLVYGIARGIRYGYDLVSEE